MGNKKSKSSAEKRIVMVGLDNSGKTTLIYKLKLGQVIETSPTIGFNIETVKYNKVNLCVWDSIPFFFPFCF